MCEVDQEDTNEPMTEISVPFKSINKDHLAITYYREGSMSVVVDKKTYEWEQLNSVMHVLTGNDSNKVKIHLEIGFTINIEFKTADQADDFFRGFVCQPFKKKITKCE